MNENRLGDKRTRPAAGVMREAVIAGRFLIVGVVATVVHMATALVLVGRLAVPALAGNTCAFLLAFCVSFSGHYFWTFSQPGKPRRALARFLAVSLTTFLGNTALLAFLLRHTALAPVVATVGSACLIPVISLLASRLWCFKTA
jgi:putative flippase GtrA